MKLSNRFFIFFENWAIVDEVTIQLQPCTWQWRKYRWWPHKAYSHQ